MDNSEPGFQILPSVQDERGALAVFPYDASLVERFRAAFPRARWRQEQRAWFVPGAKAEFRLQRWLDQEFAGLLRHADERGRDAFSFDPIQSRYLTAGEDLSIRTPYSKAVIELVRSVPWAWWDATAHAWRVPFRSIEQLRQAWADIEAAAVRSEPGERQRRRREMTASAGREDARAAAVERRRRRYPVPASDLPPCGRSVFSHVGPVVFTEITGELVSDEIANQHYPWAARAHDLIWALWRRPCHDELIHTWPARKPVDAPAKERGWWQPTIEELRASRRQARTLERAQATRRASLADRRRA